MAMLLVGWGRRGKIRIPKNTTRTSFMQSNVMESFSLALIMLFSWNLLCSYGGCVAAEQSVLLCQRGSLDRIALLLWSCLIANQSWILEIGPIP